MNEGTEKKRIYKRGKVVFGLLVESASPAANNRMRKRKKHTTKETKDKGGMR